MLVLIIISSKSPNPILYNCIEQLYPFKECIESMIEFCDEVCIVDGGSTDGSVDIIKKYTDQIAYWVSEPDRGQAHAINKGLRKATGDWLCWQNSDDIFLLGAFADLVKTISSNPKANFIIGNIILIDENDNQLRDLRFVKPNYEGMIAEGMLLANQAAFWRRDVQETIGFIDESYIYSFDYDWFLRIAMACHGLHVNRIWGALRLHNATKTANKRIFFEEENIRILTGREIHAWKRYFFQIRRLCQLLRRGDFAYVLRGIHRRIIRMVV